MLRECKYPIQLKMKLDLNTDRQLLELQEKLNKSRSSIIRLILQDFFDKNENILDKYFDREIAPKELSIVLFRDLLEFSKEDINDFLKHQQLNEKRNTK